MIWNSKPNDTSMTRRQFLKKTLWAGGILCASSNSSFAHWAPDKQRSAYQTAEEEGTFARRVEQAMTLFEACELCPRRCGVNRLKGEKGFCRAPSKAVIYSAQPHFGEESPLVGRRGSGTIFFSHCNLRCVFCQNWPIAHEGRGNQVDEKELADMMLGLQAMGCHNINLVTPTHVMPNILKAARIACLNGLHVPLVYNTSGYERTEMIRLLDGLVDIYLPDIKYADGTQSAEYSAGAEDYPKIARQAVLEMHRQVGELRKDEQGVARRGLIIRHLVMPNRVAGTRDVVAWIAANLPKSTYVNIMPQYRVEYKAFDYPEIARGITTEEYLEAMEWADEFGLTNLDDRSGALRFLYRAVPRR